MALSWAQWCTAFQTDLEAHADLTGVDVWTLPPPGDYRTLEGVFILGIDGGHDWHTMGPNFADGFTVRCRLWSTVAETDTTADAGAASRLRTETMLDAVHDIMKDSTASITTHCKAARIDSWSWTPEPWEDGSWRSNVEFSVAVVSLP